MNLRANFNFLDGKEDGGVLADAQVRKMRKTGTGALQGLLDERECWAVRGRDVCETTQRAFFFFCCPLFCVDTSECRLSVIVVRKQVG